MKHMLHGVVAALVLAFAAVPAQAVKWVSGPELIGHCKAYTDAPTSLDGVVCVAYIQGFLGGAEATDATVEENVLSQYQQDHSAFMRRVVRTRLGRSVEEYGATALANYCLPLAEPVTRVVLRVVQYIDAHPEAESLNAQEVVYGALKEHYPCPE
ncbi:MAG: Rap1a/Tai family immunity protein [Alphaproteobacteria bacterium]